MASLVLGSSPAACVRSHGALAEVRIISVVGPLPALLAHARLGKAVVA